MIIIILLSNSRSINLVYIVRFSYLTLIIFPSTISYLPTHLIASAISNN